MGLTIVIPAHQEAEVIGACLASLGAQECDLEAQVIVVANGCADGTVEVARGFQASMAERGFSLDVLQLEDAGKPEALNTGDLIACHGDRIYLDADVELSPKRAGEHREGVRPWCPVLCAGDSPSGADVLRRGLRARLAGTSIRCA